jgi:uridylate kinase
LEKGRVVILAGGTGNPYFTTDTAAALRAKEIGAEVLLKATKVDGIYERDPHQYPEARRFKHLTYHGALRRRLKVMDATAFSLCADHNIRIFVFNVFRHDSIKHVVEGTAVGTLVTGGAG